MKRRVIAGLVRLYPSRWRAEYGEELADVLMRRPLGVGAVANVVAGAVRQYEPWVIVGAPLFVWAVIYWITLMTERVYLVRTSHTPSFWPSALFFGVGLWTVLRSGRGGGRAAMKMSMLATLPFSIAGVVLLVTGAFRYAPGPDGMLGLRFRGWEVATLLCGPVLQIPFAGVLGWCGGLTARMMRRVVG